MIEGNLFLPDGGRTITRLLLEYLYLYEASLVRLGYRLRMGYEYMHGHSRGAGKRVKAQHPFQS